MSLIRLPLLSTALLHFNSCNLVTLYEAKAFGCSTKYVLITPAHKEAAFVRKTLDSIVAQPFCLSAGLLWMTFNESHS